MADTWLPVLVEIPLAQKWQDPGPPFIVNCGYAHTAVVCGAGRLYTCGWGGRVVWVVLFQSGLRQVPREAGNKGWRQYLSSYNQHGNHPINGPWDREANSAHVL